jgi:hypothetical protein
VAFSEFGDFIKLDPSLSRSGSFSRFCMASLPGKGAGIAEMRIRIHDFITVFRLKP